MTDKIYFLIEEIKERINSDKAFVHDDIQLSSFKFLLEYITQLQSQNAELKAKLEKAVECLMWFLNKNNYRILYSQCEDCCGDSFSDEEAIIYKKASEKARTCLEELKHEPN